MSRNREPFRRHPITQVYRGYRLHAEWGRNILLHWMVFRSATGPDGEEVESGADPWLPTLPSGIHQLKKYVDERIKKYDKINRI